MDDAQLGEWLKRMIAENSSWIQSQDRYNDYERAIGVYSAAFPRFLALSYEQLVEKPAEAAAKIALACNTDVNHAKFCAGLATVSNALGNGNPRDAGMKTFLDSRYSAQLSFLHRQFGTS
jgi:hypothetical protein